MVSYILSRNDTFHRDLFDPYRTRPSTTTPIKTEPGSNVEERELHTS